MSCEPTAFKIPTEAQGWDALRRPIWLFDPHGLRGVYANRSALALWGAKSLDALLARDFSQLSPAVRARTERLAQATAGGDEVTEQWTFYPNGQPVTVQATISSLTLSTGERVLQFEASATEVEAQERRAVEALRHTSTLITLFDAKGAVLFANPAAFAAYGATDHPFVARFADPARGATILAKAMGGDTVVEVCETTTAAGPRWHHVDARPVLDPVTGAAGVLLNERDVTERVEAEQARAAAEQKVAMAEARQRFLADMSHELRTPLNSVIGFSELLKTAGLPQPQADQAARIHAAGERLLTVVNDMITLSEVGSWTGEMSVGEGGVATSTPADGPADERAIRVLYIDDNESNRTLVTTILTAHGAVCETAVDGVQGLDVARSGDWDVILMDIQMPNMNGVDAARAIRLLPDPAGGVPIVALTANTLDEQLMEYAEAGMDDCIPKPVNIAALVEKVALWSESPRAARLPAMSA